MTLPYPEPDDRELDAVSLLLRSEKPGDIWRGMEQVTRWLQENPESQKIYEMLLNIVQDNRALRVKIRSLLTQMKQRGSKSSESALNNLPSNVQEVLADADDSYYAADYEDAIQLYTQVLRLDPENIRAKDQLGKAEIKRREREEDTGLPRTAEQYYRQARSFIAARDVLTAIKLLNAAIEVAQAKGMPYPDAEEALSNMQNLIKADEFKEKANLALSEERWKDVLDLYNKALALDPTNIIIKKELECFQDLLRAEAELQKKGLLKIFAPLRQVQTALRSARGVINPDNSLLKYVQVQSDRVRLTRIVGMIVITTILAVLFLSFSSEIAEIFEFGDTATVTAPITTPIISSVPTNTFAPITFETPTITASPMAAFTATITDTPTVTATLGPTPVVVLGYGRLLLNFFPVQEPNGRRIQQLIDGKENDLILPRKQLVTVVDSKFDVGGIWYKCIWKVNGVAGEGWILDKYIEFVPPPTPTP